MLLKQDIENWIIRISEKQSALNGNAICPYAIKSKYEIIENEDYSILLRSNNLEIVIFILSDNLSLDELKDKSKDLNTQYPEIVFLYDHKDKETFINGVKTNNGKYNLLLCQRRSKLDTARSKLIKTDYYNFWEKSYLEEILNS
jgi:hypothetical protein